jgi:uncharacterized membrane protein YeaQ/YmgE (transglycosylase-associated protein family)
MSPDLGGTLKAIIQGWIGALRDALIASGMAADEAGRRATAAVVAIEGALIVSRACGDRKIFSAALAQTGKALRAPA